VARSGNDTQKWYTLRGGKKIGSETHIPKKPSTGNEDTFVQMGIIDDIKEANLLFKWHTRPNRLKKLAQDNNLKGSQGIQGYYPHKVQEWYRKLLNPEFDFTRTKNRIGYYYHQGIYTVNGGHHRVVAALIILDQTGDSKVLQRLLQHGGVTESAPSPGIKKALYTIDDVTLDKVISDEDIPKPKGWID